MSTPPAARRGPLDRLLVGFGGLCGAAGVALSAAAAHAGGAYVGTVAGMLLAHAPVLLAIGLLGAAADGRWLLRLGAFVLLIGVLLFSADLLMRSYEGHRLFPMAAPAGGSLMTLGWLIVAVSALAPGEVRS